MRRGEGGKPRGHRNDVPCRRTLRLQLGMCADAFVWVPHVHALALFNGVSFPFVSTHLVGNPDD